MEIVEIGQAIRLTNCLKPTDHLVYYSTVEASNVVFNVFSLMITVLME